VRRYINTYYNYNRNYPAVLKIVLPLVESSKFGNAIAANYYYYFPILWALALRRVAVKEVEILRQERKYSPIMMMVLFRISDILYWFLAEHLSLRWSLSLL
jgi:hypothetical protein